MTERSGVAAARGRLDAVLAEAFPDLSRSRCAALVKEGAVSVDGEPVDRPAAKVAAGARLRVLVPEPAPLEAQAQDLPVRIVFEDADVIVVDKDPGMVVHPAPGHPDGTLVNALLHHVDDLSGIGGVQRPGIVHRLDRGTSGLLIVAKSDAAHQHLSAQFAEKTAGREYLALCTSGKEVLPLQGRIETMVARHPKDRMRWASTDGSFGKRAVTHYRVVARQGAVSLVHCTLETGRTHQVRVHLTEIGLPLIGDPVYKRRGHKVPATLREWLAEHPDRPLLHAWKLTFRHPRSQELITLVAPPAPDFQQALDAVGIAAPRP